MPEPAYEPEIEIPHWLDIESQLTRLIAEGTPREAKRPRHVVVLTTDHGDGGKRATLAFSTACAALAMGLDTLVFLVGDGSYWAYQDASANITCDGFPPLAELMEEFLELGGNIYLCASCDQVCSVPQAAEGRTRHPAIQLRGLAAILDHMVGGTSVTF